MAAKRKREVRSCWAQGRSEADALQGYWLYCCCSLTGFTKTACRGERAKVGAGDCPRSRKR